MKLRTTAALRVPVPKDLWIEVSRGLKSEFRQPGVSGGIPTLPLPRPCIAYRQTKEEDRQTMVLLACWREPLIAITPESLEREGFDTLDEFREHWVQVRRLLWKPAHKVTCYVVRPLEEGDREYFGGLIFDYLHEVPE